MTPEDKARVQIDAQLEAAGWDVQDLDKLNLGARLGVAVREFPLERGPVDYLLFADRKAIGVVEAKPEGNTLLGVSDQTTKYIGSIPANLPRVQMPLPFAYESTGVETLFRDIRDPDTRSRRVFAFHKPETLLDWSAQPDTLRARLRRMPQLMKAGLRDCQIEAVTNLEQSLAAAYPRALIQMASGGGKTFTAVTSAYRLIRFADARRVLFLVDRTTLGKQTFQEFRQYTTPDDGRKFTELYNVQHLTSNTLDPVSRVCITTIQRLFSMLKGEKEFDPSLEEQPLFDLPTPDKPREVGYNPQIPIETFDFIITDECHRSIYHLWRQVLEYFDGFIIGLTATPSKQTLGFFNQNLVTEYNHERAIADGVNVGYEVYRISTEITEKGSSVKAGFYLDKRDRKTRKVRWEMLDEDVDYAPNQLDRAVVARDQIRTIVRTFRDRLFTEIFPGRTEVPKTLVFAKDDSHAEDITEIMREEFGKGNDFCKKITYRTTGEKPEDLIAASRNSYFPRIAVTVDMISTGTDIRPLECLIFMRDIKSRGYFEQMKGRGTRTIAPTDIRAVTPDANAKTHFVIVDAIGVCESDKQDSRPLERKKSVPFDKLLMSVALGNRDEDTLSSLAGRLARLDREITDKDRGEIAKVANSDERIATSGVVKRMVNSLLDAIDPDKGEPIARQALANKACLVFDNAELRNTLIEIKQRSEQIIDTVSKDKVVLAGFDDKAKEKAQSIVQTFKRFIEENKNELTALQLIYGKPYGSRRLTYEQIKQLADSIRKPPYYLTAETVWTAYEKLESARVHGAGPQKLLTDIISLVRFALGETKVLEPFAETVNQRFAAWIAQQEKANRRFSPEQMDWLRLIKDHIATSLAIAIDDLELAPFYERGGPVKAYQVLGKDLEKMLEELNGALVA
jgi:type I restriction enzyme R subunit